MAARSTGVGVTTGSLARTLGVSPTTLRSWDRRYGIGPAERTDGRHRRWTPEDVAMLQEMCRFTAEGLPPAEAARAAKERARDRTRSPALTLTRSPAAPRAPKSPSATALPAGAPAPGRVPVCRSGTYDRSAGAWRERPYDWTRRPCRAC
ncbi:MerR family transcriptional regulator [Streptomyces sp. NPDC087843]|uniref:MerR family transcriptional regulator n=1 Tax=Streptomyces sp. NPDC087843 TaxID=3365804 RepID=UPI00380A42DD